MTFATPPPVYRAVLSPCTGVCTIDTYGLCGGCHRTLDEIARWSVMGDAERLRLIETVLPERERRGHESA